ncbi:MAG: hypothetical protein CM1200mP18_15730 [Gammaproteobacteria bacterium]|nr:MAG: hypothetical protein CM1200mP18_15730 [Gammaproteobacteria bacterium]
MDFWVGASGAPTTLKLSAGKNTLTSLSTPWETDEIAAYDAPFPDSEYKAGARAFPELVPEQPDDEGAALSRQARAWLKDEWMGKTFMAIGMRDPVLHPGPCTIYVRISATARNLLKSLRVATFCRNGVPMLQPRRLPPGQMSPKLKSESAQTT